MSSTFFLKLDKIKKGSKGRERNFKDNFHGHILVDQTKGQTDWLVNENKEIVKYFFFMLMKLR